MITPFLLLGETEGRRGREGEECEGIDEEIMGKSDALQLNCMEEIR